jgi:hypothetical protein
MTTAIALMTTPVGEALQLSHVANVNHGMRLAEYIRDRAANDEAKDKSSGKLSDSSEGKHLLCTE